MYVHDIDNIIYKSMYIYRYILTLERLAFDTSQNILHASHRNLNDNN